MQLDAMLTELLPKFRQFAKGKIDRRLRARFDTSDVVQEAAIQVWRKALDDGLSSEVQPPAAAWMKTVAFGHSAKLHAFHTAQRRTAIREQMDSELADNHLKSANEQADIRDEANCLLSALGRLTEMQRSIIHERIVNDFSFNRIATILDLSPDRVRRQYHESIRQLRLGLSSQ